MSANERRPAGAPSEARWPESSVPEPTHAGADDAPLTREYLEGYEAGLIYGDVIGYQRAHDEWHARAEVSAAVARQIANTPSYAELAIRRGQPARAAAQVATLIRNGVTP